MTLQKILGKNYKWWFIINYYFKAQLYYRGNSFMFALAEFVGFGGSLLVWFLTTQNNVNYSTPEILTYLWVGSVYTGFIPIWYSENLASQIHGGGLSSKLLRPVSIFSEAICEFIGRGTLGSSILLNVGSFLLLPIVWQYLIFPSNPINFAIFILMLPIAFFTKFCVEFLFGSLTFWLTSYNGLLNFKDALVFFLQGGKIPLTVLINFIPLIIWQHIAFQLHHQMQIYLGKY